MSKYLPLSNSSEMCLVDDYLYEMVKNTKWSLTNCGYVQGSLFGGNCSIHRLVMGARKGEEVDHINRIKTDNRRENLRIVSRSENVRNTVKCRRSKGASLHKQSGKWRSSIQVDGKRRFLGLFPTEAEAVAAYRAACAEHGFRVS